MRTLSFRIRMLPLLAIAAAGCDIGGPPFEYAALETGTGDDGGAPAPEASSSDAGGDGQVLADRDTSAPPEADPPRDAGPEADVCTPLPLTPASYECAGITMCNALEACIYDLTPEGGYPWAQCYPLPSACQCQETYSCDCLSTNQSGSLCQSGKVEHCSIVNGKLTVRCG